ncbi:hypothetical protein C8T65DRAFT_639583 [Cerioporus squamosus]|nr:hypothetical protein C8T65DRAFT_639583 [Cerioporus squamosus]
MWHSQHLCCAYLAGVGAACDLGPRPPSAARLRELGSELRAHESWPHIADGSRELGSWQPAHSEYVYNLPPDRARRGQSFRLELA